MHSSRKENGVDSPFPLQSRLTDESAFICSTLASGWRSQLTPERRSPMQTIRPEVLTFLYAAETLLSPALITTPFNVDECGMINGYVESIRQSILGSDSQICES